MSRVLDQIVLFQHKLEKYAETKEPEKLLYYIRKLKHLDVTVSHLEETGVGRSVNALRHHQGQVGEKARGLVSKWKTMVNQEEEAKAATPEDEDEEDEALPRQEMNGNRYSRGRHGENGAGGREEEEEEEEEEEDRLQITEDNEADNEDYNYTEEMLAAFKPDPNYGYQQHHGYGSDDGEEEEDEGGYNPVTSQQDYMKASTAGVTEAEYHPTSLAPAQPSSSCSSSSGPAWKDVASPGSVSLERTDTPTSKSSRREEKERSRGEKDRGGERHREDKEKKHKHKHKSDRDKSKSHKDKHKDKDRHSDKSSKECKVKSEEERVTSHRQSSSDTLNGFCSTPEVDSKSTPGAVKSEKKSEKVREKSEKSSHSSHRKDGSADRTHVDGRESGRTGGESVKSKDKHRDRHKDDKHREKSKERSSRSERHRKEGKSEGKGDGSSSSSSSKDKKKKKSSTVEDDAGFGEALMGLDSPVKKKKKKKKEAERERESSEEERPSTSRSAASSSSKRPHLDPPSLPDPKKPKLLAAAPQKLPVLPSSIDDTPLLPEITPNYKPLPRLPIREEPDNCITARMTEEEALNIMLQSKANRRSKVYSGRATGMSHVPKLFDLCIRVLQENIDALEATNVPYDVLKPVLERANPQQLINIENYNPSYLMSSSPLWENHCRKDFKNKTREEMETWRDLWLRCFDEREKKLRSLTHNLQQKFVSKAEPKRTTKLAFVDQAVKVPRSVARAQAKHGTAVASAAAAKPGKANEVAARKLAMQNVQRAERAAGANPRPSSAKNKKVAPLMAKTRQFFKKAFRR